MSDERVVEIIAQIEAGKAGVLDQQDADDLRAALTQARPICEECGEPMHPGDGPNGPTWGCDLCGWSFDVEARGIGEEADWHFDKERGEWVVEPTAEPEAGKAEPHLCAGFSAPTRGATPKARKRMTRFRKKPVVIEAVRWTGDNLREVIGFTGLHPSAEKWTWKQYEAVVKNEGLKIFTLEGPLHAAVGDWIIKGVQGEFYPCKPDIFEQTYEPVESEEG